MQPKPVVFDAKELQGKPALNNTLAKSPKAIRQIQKILVPHAISYLGYGWCSSSAGGVVSAILQYIVETNNIGGLHSKYESYKQNKMIQIKTCH